MNRRRFLQVLTGSALSAVAAEAIPFNRVWSFPSNVVCISHGEQIIWDCEGPWIYDYANQAFRKIQDERKWTQFSSNHVYQPIYPNLDGIDRVYYEIKGFNGAV